MFRHSSGFEEHPARGARRVTGASGEAPHRRRRDGCHPGRGGALCTPRRFAPAPAEQAGADRSAWPLVRSGTIQARVETGCVPRRLIVITCLIALAGCGSADRTATRAVPATGHPREERCRPRAAPVRAAPPGASLSPCRTRRRRGSARARARWAGSTRPTSRSRTSSSVSRSGPRSAAGRLPAAVHDAAAATLGAPPTSSAAAIAGRRATDRRRRRAQHRGATAAPGLRRLGRELGGTAYVVGGYDGVRPLNTIVAWRPGAPARVVARLPQPVRYAAVAAVGGRVLVAGGTPGTGAFPDLVSFDPGTRRVRRLGRLPLPLSHAAGAALDGSFLVIGGRDAPARSCARSSPWTRRPGAPGARDGCRSRCRTWARRRCRAGCSWSAAATSRAGPALRRGAHPRAAVARASPPRPATSTPPTARPRSRRPRGARSTASTSRRRRATPSTRSIRARSRSCGASASPLSRSTSRPRGTCARCGSTAIRATR